MDKMKKGILWSIVIVIGFMISAFFIFGMRASAATGEEGLVTNVNAPFVSRTPDLYGWTVYTPLPAGEDNFAGVGSEHTYWYPMGTVLYTGVPSNLPVAGVGQHIYDYDRVGVIPIERWEVLWERGKCIHTYTAEYWHGLTFGRDICEGAYYSGWKGFCADCGGEFANYNLYMDKVNMQKLQGIDNRYEFFYRCPDPDCGHLEQQSGIYAHNCQDVSYNQYRVKYESNMPLASGSVNNTYHMYNNATEYEGQPAVNCTDRLSDNNHGFVMTGYKVVGWDLTPGDPYGEPDFTVGQKLTTNLSADDWKIGEEDGSGKGTVTLYAVWAKVEGDVTIKPGTAEDIAKGADYNDSDAVNATYNSAAHSTTVKGAYLTSYVLDDSELVAPVMGTVYFDTRGGSYVPPITVRREFKSWEKGYPFYGTFSESLGKYVFSCLDDGFSDTITATWKDNTITLPDAEKEDEVFAGWYEDPECTEPVGAAGDPYTPDGDKTLYAKWSKLVLYSETDLAVDGWKGGVDLTWTQEDSREKFYKIYQRKAGTDTWKQIFSATDVGGSGLWSGGKVEKTTAGTQTVTIPATGFYTIDAYGAQGSDYNGKVGGKGGYVTGKFWLKKGDVLTYSVGSRTDGGSGGVGAAGTYGGGATKVTSAMEGTLLIAGGGGGASWYQNGGAGGLTSGLVTGSEGANGAAGGGDGYRGGGGGTVVMHTHSSSCYHYHAGDAISGGGCYAWKACGGTLVLTREKQVIGYYTNYPNYENHLAAPNWDYWWDRCKQCAQNPCQGGHPKYNDPEYTCNICGRKQNTGGTCTYSTWKLSCGKSQAQVVCGMGNNTIVSANPSYGGSNYINTAKAVSSSQNYGVRSGVGYFSVKLNEVGYFDALRLDDVSAHDEAKPDAVDLSTVSIEAAEGTAVKVSFEKPADHGTVYYHYAESYLATNRNTVLSTTKASPTYNNIVEGVYWYYYVLDTQSSTVVTAANKQGASTTNAVKVLVNPDYEQWLHIAAVDRAGNISDTVHVKIDPVNIEWNIKTQQIGVSSVVGGIDYGSVYPNGTNSYYVKADGNTPFDLSFRSYVEGNADADYQIDNEQFAISSVGIGSQQFDTILPKSNASVAGTVSLNTSLFWRGVSGATILSDARYTTANRYSYASVNNFAQAFAAPSALSGKTVTVIPHAGASFVNVDGQDDVKWSDASADAANKVTLILDGVGPDVSGTGPLDGIDEIDLNAGDIDLDIFASDDLSGLKDIVVNVTNLDDGTRKVYNQGADGRVELTITRDDSIFHGSFAIEIVAKDNVGNKTVITYQPVSLALEATISKVRDDGLSTYAKGEGAYLNITTHGYVDKVIIEWPAKILAENPTLPTEIDYTSNKLYTQMEKISFVVPLAANEGEILEIPVRAIKGGLEKIERPYLEVSGNALDDIRYRIK